MEAPGELSAADKLLSRLREGLEEDHARGRDALQRQEEASGIVGRLMFKLELRRDLRLRESMEYARITEENRLGPIRAHNAEVMDYINGKRK